jgi:hypothetical protein
MGNSCTCVQDGKEDPEEFKGMKDLNKEKKVVKIQATYRGRMARK